MNYLYILPFLLKFRAKNLLSIRTHILKLLATPYFSTKLQKNQLFQFMTYKKEISLSDITYCSSKNINI